MPKRRLNSVKSSGLQINNLRAARQSKHLRPEELARRSHLPLSRLRAIERGGIATVEEWAMIADALGTAPSNLVFDSDGFVHQIEGEIIKLRRERELEQSHATELNILAERAELARKKKTAHLTQKHYKEHDILQNKIRQIQRSVDTLDSSIFVRELVFPTQYHEAGVTILQGFIKLLRERYSDRSLSTSIRQDGTKITLIIEGIDGFREEVSEYLDRYGEVVMGREPITTVTDDKLVALELRNQLDIARSQLQTQREITHLLRSDFEKRLNTIEERERWMQSQIGFAMTSLAGELHSALENIQENTKLADALTRVKVALASTAPKEQKKSVIRESLDRITTDGVAPAVAESVKALLDKLASLVT